MRWLARAPCRVDLAGGTLDIWPLGLFVPGARTVNVAIDLHVTVEVALGTASNQGFRVRQGGQERVAQELAALRADPETALLAEVCEHLGASAAEVEINSESPRGAGLGGSSALTVALLAALGEAIGRVQPASAVLAAEARDLEARLMRLPTGIQDHAPALLGGAVVVEHRIGGSVSRPLGCDLEALGRSLLVVHTGQSHFSAGNNWAIIRRALDGDPLIAAHLESIAEAAVAAEDALVSGDLEALGQAMGRDWSRRRELASEISTATIETLLEAALSEGAWGGKACGAGGGGCVALLAPSKRRGRIADRLRALGGVVLDTAPTGQGLAVRAE